MDRQILPISALPTWARLNNVAVQGVKVDDLGGIKWYGLIAENALNSKFAVDAPALVIVPPDILLSAKTVEEYAKLNHHFGQLLEIAGARSRREDIMLYLLMQLSIGPPKINEKKKGFTSPWTEYIAMLPTKIPVPTMWRKEELRMLKGTSLEAAVCAKLSTLQREFDTLRDVSRGISWCDEHWWEAGKLKFHDWILLDAWFRSRSLELPTYGEIMVPFIDMVNHSKESNSYYQLTSENEIALLLKPDLELKPGSEITINYGTSKSEAEMLYSYGFIDQESTFRSLTLFLEPQDDDPIGKAKLAAYPGSPSLRVYCNDGHIKWESSFVYFMCLNEEDGLEFKVLQQTDGNQSSLHVFWQDLDVSGFTENFESLIEDHPLHKIFELRVVTILQHRIDQQLDMLSHSDKIIDQTEANDVNSVRKMYAMRLRKSEKSILEQAFESLQTQKAKLLVNEIIKNYIFSGDTQIEELDINDESDFS